MFKNISLDSVWSGETCLANLGVQSCPVRKLISIPSPVETSGLLNILHPEGPSAMRCLHIRV